MAAEAPASRTAYASEDGLGTGGPIVAGIDAMCTSRVEELTNLVTYFTEEYLKPGADKRVLGDSARTYLKVGSFFTMTASAAAAAGLCPA